MNRFLGLPASFTNKRDSDFSTLIENYKPMSFDVSNQNDEAVIDIDGFIGSDPFMEFMTGKKSPNTVESLKEQLRAIDSDKIIVNINSPGGSFNDGIVIMDLLKAKRAEVVTNLYGLSASAATIIWQAGDKRRISKNGFSLIHRVMGGLLGYFNSPSLLSMAADLEPLDGRLIDIYAERSTSTRDEIIELMDEGEGYGRFINAQSAVDMGLADEVFDASEEDENVDRMNNALLDTLSLRNTLQTALKNTVQQEPEKLPENQEKTALNKARLQLMKMKNEESNGLL